MFQDIFNIFCFQNTNMLCDASFTGFSMKMETTPSWVCHEGISASIWLSRKILSECGWQYPWVLDSESGDRAHLPLFPHCTHSTMADSCCYDFFTVIDTAQIASQILHFLSLHLSRILSQKGGQVNSARSCSHGGKEISWEQLNGKESLRHPVQLPQKFPE